MFDPAGVFAGNVNGVDFGESVGGVGVEDAVEGCGGCTVPFFRAKNLL